MINMWPAQFEESPQVAPRAVVEEQALLLGGLTGGRVVAEVVEGDRLDRSTLAGVAFIYRLELVGPYLNDYRFSVMTFYHDISMYPVNILLDEGIAAELGMRRNAADSQMVVASDEQQLESHLQKILRTKRLRDVVGSILKLSRG
ncbi:MAG: hypothetical protein JWP52_2433 [Rhizobacter sp.]|nr:hypothetical protein [Rhizobacter sp.]